jgi:hypothetical protein
LGEGGYEGTRKSAVKNNIYKREEGRIISFRFGKHGADGYQFMKEQINTGGSEASPLGKQWNKQSLTSGALQRQMNKNYKLKEQL